MKCLKNMLTKCVQADALVSFTVCFLMASTIHGKKLMR